MSRHQIFMTIGIVMALMAGVFFLYAIEHPEASFAWGNEITYVVYGIYVLVMIVMFVVSVYFRGQ